MLCPAVAWQTGRSATRAGSAKEEDMSGLRRILAAGSVIAAVIVGIQLPAGAATAHPNAGVRAAAVSQSGPTITYYLCEQGVRNIICEVSYIGGVAPVTIRWYWARWTGSYWYTFHVPSWDNLTTVTGGCRPGDLIAVRAVVTDANGASDDDAQQRRCVTVIP